MKIYLSDTSYDNLSRGISISTKNIVECLKDDFEFTSYRYEPETAREGRDEYINKYIYEQHDLPQKLKGLDADVIWFSKNNGIVADTKIKKLSTLYDLIALDFPNLQGGKEGFTRSFTRLSRIIGAIHSDAIVVPSFFTKTRILHHFNIDERKIFVSPLACDKNLFNQSSISPEGKSMLSKLIGSDYILAVGAYNLHKNYKALIHAYIDSILPREGIKLVLVGPKDDNTKGNYKSHLEAIVSENNQSENVIFLTDFNHENGIENLYKGCLFFVNPTLYEGFGIPALEAMACGKAVISSLKTAQSEVVGDAAYPIDPDDVVEITFAIDTLAKNSSLRNFFSQKSIERSAMFSWKKSAQVYKDAFENLL